MTWNNFPGSPSAVGVPIGGQSLSLGGKVFFVDTVNGSDGNSGLLWNRAKKTIFGTSGAYAACTSGNNDVVYMIGNATADSQTTAQSWAKHYTHLIGLAAPTTISPRARITQAATATGVSPLMTISANGCIFKNVQFFQGVDDSTSLIACKVSGDRNYFEGVHFAGLGHATIGDQAAAFSLQLNDGDENRFVNCTIGLDTIARSTTNAEIDFTGESQRNIFENCLILSYADNAGHIFVQANAASDIDRWNLFRNCLFLNGIKSAGTTMTEAFDVHASVGGFFYLNGCQLYGATDWEAATVSGNVIIDSAPPTAATSGLAVAVAAS